MATRGSTSNLPKTVANIRGLDYPGLITGLKRRLARTANPRIISSSSRGAVEVYQAIVAFKRRGDTILASGLLQAFGVAPPLPLR